MKRFSLFLLMSTTCLAATAQSFQVTAISPAEGAEVAGIAKGEYVKFKTNMDDVVKGIQYDYRDITTGESLYTTFATSYDSEEQCWAIKNFSNAVTDFVKGHTIQFVVNAYDEARPSSNLIGSDTITWIGAGSAEFEYSPVEVTTVYPAAGSSLMYTSQNEFIITYSAPVEINPDKSCIITGQQQSVAFERITPNADNTQWTLVVKESLLAVTTPQLYFNVYVRDAEGKVLRGNQSGAFEQEEMSYFKYKYVCYFGSPDLTVTPATGEATSLKEFTISYDGGIALSYVKQTPIQLLKSDQSEVASIALSQLTRVNNNTFSFSLDEEVTAPGNYALYIPQEIFALGTEFNSYTSKMQTVEYTIAGSLAIESINPEEGTALTQMPKRIEIEFNQPEQVGYGVWSVAESVTGEVVTQGQLRKEENATTWYGKTYFAESLRLYEGHEYTFTVKVYADEMDYNYGNEPIAELSANWKGAAISYTFSTSEFVSVTPDDYSTITSGELLATFSGPVVITKSILNNGLANDINCTAVPNEDKTVWTITIPETSIKTATGSLNVNVWAKDAEGKVVKGNVGEEENSYFEWTFLCYEGCPTFTVSPADGEEVETLTEIKVSDPAGIAISYNSWEPIQIVKMRNVVCEISYSDIKFSADGKVGTITLPKAITEAGTYQIIFPAMYFAIGEQFSSVMSKAQTVEFTIKGGETPGEDPEQPSTGNVPVSVTPAEGIVASLKKITVKFAEGSFVGLFDGMTTATLYDEAGEAVATGTPDFDWDDVVIGYLNLDKEITTPGTYKLVVPAGTFALDENGSVLCDAFTYTFTIESSSTGINTISIENNQNNYDINGRRANGTRGIVIRNGQKRIVF